MPVVIARENPDQPDIRTMLADADAWYATLYPAESNHLLDVTTLQKPTVTFLVARDESRALLGCGAVVDCGEYAQIKRMFVLPQARGLKLGRKLLEALEAEAGKLGRRCFRLETGIRQPAAIGLYVATGYRDCPPFGSYRHDPLSRFMEKRI